ncbi:threonine ammonia-lyase [Abyssibacter sp.]|jgi:threonine dehydratase|uniref:threonine ammonia-lyase n=1 Tax=Abyssibacter sp. TaxID=2320200 RepID=UPI000C5CE017|nr:threonine ammonia-lyase [Abyssibacter sp.]MBB87612.1 threonine ammonia-lyase [Xanthomonadales bacterium]MCK5860029.1 threonine ammonia-lyase [Abyssibacter sp.]
MICFDDIRAAANTLAGQVTRTALQRSRVLSKMTGAEVYLKFETFQFTASFKERGALNKLASLSEAERQVGVVAMSAGNHAQAVAYHARRLGIDSTIVMPVNTPFTKIRNTRDLGATVVLHGENLAEAQGKMEELVAEGRTLVHPYDDPLVMAGQGTVALEMLEDQPDLDTLVVPIGGGGLMSGCAVAAKAMKPDIRMIGVESEGYCSAWAAISGQPDLPKGGQTIAEGIAVKNVGHQTLDVIRQWVDEFAQVPETAIERAVGLIVNVEKVIVEGAGAAGLAAMLTEPERYRGRKVGLVLCGANIDTRLLASVLTRQLVLESRLVHLQVAIQDSPGFLGRVAAAIGQAGGNIVQVHHQRLQVIHHPKDAVLDALVEAQDEAHAQRIIEALEQAGFKVARGVSGIE